MAQTPLLKSRIAERFKIVCKRPKEASTYLRIAERFKIVCKRPKEASTYLISRISPIALLILFLGLPILDILGQESNQPAEESGTFAFEKVCQSTEEIEARCRVLSVDECRALLEKCENYYIEKSAQIEKDITKTQQEKKTLQNQIYILRKKVENLDFQIKQSNMMIKDLTFQIKDTEISIKNTSLKIEDSRQKLTEILALIYEEDQKTLVEILLSEPNLSDFFDNLMVLETLNNKNQELLKNIKGLKVELETQRQSLDGEKEDLEKLTKIQLLQKQEGETTKKEQEKLLEVTKGKESEYQKILTETKKRAAELRSRIFELMGVPEAPTFGEALDIARYVEKITGVRPALLLAVLEQESALGKNIGQCYLVDPSTGEGVRLNNNTPQPRTMNPTRDVPHFLNITQELGRNPYKTVVSCPMSFGWGGAMGPAQFIPSTWALYKDRVKGIVGSADPWNIKDSFIAAALYLADYGASKQTRDAEWRAAMIYFSGSTNPKYSFYGNSVLSRADRIEGWIADIEKANGNQ